MKNTLVSLVFIICSFFNLFAQNTALIGVYSKERDASRRAVPYQFVREADVMWSKTIWRKIDLKEKINHTLYYPETVRGERKSLIDLLLFAIDKGLIAYTAEIANVSDEFKQPTTSSEIKQVGFDAVDKVKMIEDVETQQLVERKVKGEVKSSEVKSYLVKELWFFDKQRSVLDVRIIGLCPIREYISSEDPDQVKFKKLFWVYFPQAREWFGNNMVFNPYNDADHMTFDDVFFKRYFSSYIVKESNTFNDRQIDEYTVGVESLLEAERIKENIFNFEHDLWEY